MAVSEEPWDLVIGQVTAPFGVEGEVRIRPDTDDPARFRRLRHVCLEFADGTERRVRLRRARVTSKGVLAVFAGYEDREKAGALRGALVKIRQSMALPLPEGSYYLHQLVGLRVVTEDGRELGEITEVLKYPANDVYVTPQAMIPAVRDVVKRIDLAAKRMEVALLPEETAG